MDEVSGLIGGLMCPPTENADIVQNLTFKTLEGKWDEVVKIYTDYPWTHKQPINDYQDTALHIAVDNGQEITVAELVSLIVRHEKSEKELLESALATKNERGDTPLHLASSRGFAKMCHCIVGESKERGYLVKLPNEDGERPAFLAALNWHRDAFLYLHQNFPHSTADLTRRNRDTILHCVIEREYFDLAVIIIHYHKDFMNSVNNNGETPLKRLATKPLAFRSSSNLGWFNKLLYHCILVEEVDVETATKLPPDSTLKIDIPDPKRKRHPENYEICCEFSRKLQQAAASFGFFTKKQQLGDTENQKTQQKKEVTVDQKLGNLPPNYATFSQCLKSAYVLAAGLSGLGLAPVKRMKEKHVWSAQLLDLLMEFPSEAYVGSGSEPLRVGESSDVLQFMISSQRSKQKPSKQGGEDEEDREDSIQEQIEMKDTPLLIAAKNGIVEMVDKILYHIPMVIRITSSEHKRNIFLVAVESRQPLVVETLKNHKLWPNLILEVDANENTALCHGLAA